MDEAAAARRGQLHARSDRGFLALGQPKAGDGLLDVDAIVHARDGVTPWRFLSALAERREIAFHGTGDPNIESFEPREPIDFAPFGPQKAVSATTDQWELRGQVLH